MIKEIRFVLKSSELTYAEKLILIYMQACAGDKNICYPSLSSIARDCYLSKVHVIRALKSLVRKGWLEITPCVNRRTNMYRLKIKERMGDKVDERILKQAVAEAKKREEEILTDITYRDEQEEVKEPVRISEIFKKTQNSYWAKISGLSDEEIEEKRQIARKYLEEMKKKASG